MAVIRASVGIATELAVVGEPVRAENPIRRRDQGLLIDHCVHNNVGNREQ